MTHAPSKVVKRRTPALAHVEELTTELQLVLRTKQAQLLVRGRSVQGKPLITGLLGFADRIRLIWQAAEEDDPYADWFLIKTHDSLSVAEDRIHSEISKLEERLRSTRTFFIAPTEVKEPFRMTLRFSTPYAYRLARALGEFDELSCYAFTAKKIGLINSDQCHGTLRGTARRIRAVLNIPVSFRRLGLIRQNGITGTDSYKRAQDLMGSLPADVLDASRRAPLAPLILGVAARDIPPVTTETADDVVFD